MAEAVDARCKELGLTPGQFAYEAGLTRQGLADVRNGRRKKYQDRLKFGIARALHWRNDWYEQLLAGLSPEPNTTATPSVEARLAQLETRVAGLVALEAEVRQLRDSLAALLEQRRPTP